MSKPLVSILSITYNHEKYVAEALESFVMQKTDFDFEVIIADDASPDNTQAVIQQYAEQYPEIIKPILREKNIGMMPNFINTLYRCQGKYIALCEGDDYWTDPYKLQKQVDFLEGHEDINRCVHNYEELSYDNKFYVSNKFFRNQKISKDQIILSSGGLFATASYMFRRINIIDHLDFFKSIDIISGDYFIELLLLMTGDTYFLEDVMCVRRKNNMQSVTNVPRSIKNIIQISDSHRLALDSFNDYSGKLFDKAIKEKTKKSYKTEIRSLMKKDKKVAFAFFLKNFFKLKHKDVYILSYHFIRNI